MPLASNKESKQNEKNSILDFSVLGKQITLKSRPSPPCSRSSSRIDTALRPMSATPTLFHQQEKHRKTPPWTRPQSADHLSRGTHRSKLAAKFERTDRKLHKNPRKNGGSMGNLLASSSFEDNLDSETSVTPSPVPSLTEVLRSGKLEPGLVAKPPIPPVGGNPKKPHKSMDDIINIKFQRWFPESVIQKSPYANCNGLNYTELNSPTKVKENLDNEIFPTEENLQQPRHAPSHSTENLTRLPQNNPNEETKILEFDNFKFDAYEGPRIDMPSKKISRSQTMETIVESDDVPVSPEHSSRKSVTNKCNGTSEILMSKVGQTLNKYYNTEDCQNNAARVDFSVNNGNENYEKEMISMIENCKMPSKVIAHLMTENRSIGPEHAVGLEKVLEDENAACVLNYLGDTSEVGLNKCNDQHLNNHELPKNGENGLNTEDILTWMGKNQGVNNAVGSTYNDILNMLKVLEKEEVESIKLDAVSSSRSGNNSACSMAPAVGAKDILTFLDELDRSDSRNEFHHTAPPVQEAKNDSPPYEPPKPAIPIGTGRMAQLMALDSAELAKRVMAMTLELEERESILHSTTERLKEIEEKQAKNKLDSDATVKRHQKFIDQLLTEKRLLADQCASLVKEMEGKHSKALQAIDERHNIELKKLQEKMLAAEKIRREKWLEEKTKKIKEQTVKGLEPELERMTRTHQEELAEIRRAHEKELAEMEASCSRRVNAAREQSLRDREQAVTEEREAARKKLEHELSEVERSYQDQRRRLMAEVRDEKERVGRESEASLLAKSKQLEEKWQQAKQELDEKLAIQQEKHEAELKSMRDMIEAERQSWLNHQTSTLAEKEQQIREQCKKERDRHIDAVIRKLDQEAQEKEKIVESKLMKVKEQYEADLKDAEAIQADLRKKLKETRNENQQNEEMFGKLKSQINHLEFQLTTARQKLEMVEREASEKSAIARSEVSSQITALQKELADERFRKEEMLASLQAEKEKELQQVYKRVKEAISKKEETIRLVQKQRDAALEQCNQLENILDQQRKDFVQRKHH
ncbi:centrosomal protein of 131 kDa [Cimex lectularius]|uniref:5-azacytidine-induced protein 1 n=1 Tax=Cimex lectularius TaxID=79782 RepID=A0A8I6RLI4_CIMLE|nr:centrosomal protein of 131 kDa [Cimex lectularius]